MQRPPFPTQIDNTMRAAFTSCPRKAWLRFFRSHVEPYPSVHLHAGQAFAKGLEVARTLFYTGQASAEDAIAEGWAELIATYGDFQPPEKAKNKSAHRLGEALVSYFDQYPLDTDHIKPAMMNGKPAVEFTFAIPLPIPHPETGEPILYCGRFDMLGETHGQLFVVDEKTTGSLGEYWSKRYELSSQFTGYCWAARRYGYPVVGALIRGIGILAHEIKHAAIPLLRPDFMIDEWYSTLIRDIEEMVRAWKATGEQMEDQWHPLVWKPDLGDACGSYGGCEFLSVCQADPAIREKMLQINYVQRVWTPLNFQENE